MGWHAICPFLHCCRGNRFAKFARIMNSWGMSKVTTDQWQMVSGKRILVVEDDDLFRRSLCGLIHSLGYNVLPAESVEAALKVCETTRIDLVLTDFQLVGKTGIDLIAALRRSGIDVPSIVISGYPAEEIRERSHGVAFAAYIRKPAELYRLQDLLPDLLGEAC